MAIIGIDLGTTNSLAAVWRNGKSELIPNAAGGVFTPSAVSVDEDGSILVGQAARERLISHPDRTAVRFKRYMGTDKIFELGGQSFTPEELSAQVLRSLRKDAEAYLGEPVEEAVLAVPSYFARAQRSAARRAGALAGLRVEQLVNEPSAAALAARIAEGDRDKVCMVFDLGGGTLDVSLVERFEDMVSITAVSGDDSLGGTEFDYAIARAFCRETGIDMSALPEQKKELLVRQAEACKIALDTQEPVIMAVDDGELSASLPLTNKWLARSCQELFQRLAAPVRRVLVDAGISVKELDELVLVGGSAHMPAVRKYISRLLGRKPAKDSHPDAAVALGAGMCAGMRARETDLKEFVLTDVCPFTLGIASYNHAEPDRALMSPLIERNCVLPVSKEEVYFIGRNDEEAVDIQVYRGESLYCADNVFLGSLKIALPKARRERQPVWVRFTYDINGILEVEAVNQNGEAARLLLRDEAMPDREVERRLAELSVLKLHPREREGPRSLITRAERLYETTVGNARELVFRMLGWYQEVLNGQDRLMVAKASRKLERFLDEMEEWAGEDRQPDFDLGLLSGDDEEGEGQ